MGGPPEPGALTPTRQLGSSAVSVSSAYSGCRSKSKGSRSSQQVACSHRHPTRGGSFVFPSNLHWCPSSLPVFTGNYLPRSTVVLAFVFCLSSRSPRLLAAWQHGKGKASPEVRSLASRPGLFTRAVQAPRVCFLTCNTRFCSSWFSSTIG